VDARGVATQPRPQRWIALSDRDFRQWRTAMSVIVIVKFPGAHVERFREVYGRHAEMMKAISTEGRSKGAIHHQFVEDENGGVMVIDEWGTQEEFEGFFGAQEDIKKFVGELGLTGQPTSVSYQVLDTPDRF
jgi:hypothetical protein